MSAPRDPEDEVTPEPLYERRREFLKDALLFAATATGVGLGFSMLARLDAVAPAWVMLILSGYALFHARRGPRVRIAEIHPDHLHSNHGRHFGGFHW